MTAMNFVVGAAMMENVCIRVMSVMVNQTVQMDQMNPPQLAVHLPVPVIQTFVFKMERRFFLDKTVENVIMILGILIGGAATVDSVCGRGNMGMERGMSAMVDQSVQMDQMNPPQYVVHLPAPVIQTFVFKLDRILYLDKTVETALLSTVGRVLVGAATVDSVC